MNEEPTAPEGRLEAHGRRRITYANLMSTLAVGFALAGGTAIAAVKLSPGSVTSKTVKNNSLTSADLANKKGVSGADVADGSLTGADLADGSLTGADLADGSLTGADLAPGSIGSGQLGKGVVGKTALGPDSVDSSSVADGTLTGSDLGTDTLTPRQLQVSTLGTVPDAATLGGFHAADFLSAQVVSRETPIEEGEPLGIIGFRIRKGCEPGERLLAGGPANVAASSKIFEDGPEGGKWVVAIAVNPTPSADPFSVAVLCGKSP